MNRILDEDHPSERNGLVCRLRRDEEITAQNVAGSTQRPHLFRTLLHYNLAHDCEWGTTMQRVTVKDAH